MIFRLPRRPALGITLHLLLLACGLQFLYMLLACFGCFGRPEANLPVRILMSVVFALWLAFYIVCIRGYFPLFFSEIELREDSVVVTNKGGEKTYGLTAYTRYDGVRLSGLEPPKGEGGRSLALNYILLGSDNLRKLIDLLDRRSGRMPFQF
ncbi:MAG: hypothetical protein IK083_02360 [Abditibacteriota bacterium]|nr:hypothetical protein [Abditibacteriota bacterium]